MVIRGLSHHPRKISFKNSFTPFQNPCALPTAAAAKIRQERNSMPAAIGKNQTTRTTALKSNNAAIHHRGLRSHQSDLISQFGSTLPVLSSGSHRHYKHLPRLECTPPYAQLTDGGDAQTAEDVTQTVFLALAEKAKTLPADLMLGGWLHQHTRFLAGQPRTPFPGLPGGLPDMRHRRTPT